MKEEQTEAACPAAAVHIMQGTVCKNTSHRNTRGSNAACPVFSLNSLPCGIRSMNLAVTRVRICMETTFRMMYRQSPFFFLFCLVTTIWNLAYRPKTYQEGEVSENTQWIMAFESTSKRAIETKRRRKPSLSLVTHARLRSTEFVIRASKPGRS
ncbi:hypothetical protein ISCGN_006761 [Ixodes scapularis]